MNDRELIASAYDALDFLNAITHTPYRNNIAKLALIGERAHRKNNTGPYKAPPVLCARMFAVRWLTLYATITPIKADDLLGMRPDAQLAAMVSAKYSSRIVIALNAGGFNIGKLRSLDYVKLVRGA